MGTIRGVASQAPQLLAQCDRGALGQGITANTFTQIAPLPAAQVNKGAILNAPTGVFTPALSGYYRISGTIFSTTVVGAASTFGYLYQGSTALRNLCSDAAPVGAAVVMNFSNVAFLSAGAAYHLRFLSTVGNTITEMQLAIEYVSP